MSLKTFKISYHEGRVCYITDSTTGYKATVECYELCQAFRLSYDRKCPLHVGDWIKFRGTTRINTKIRKNGKPSEKILYYHEPHDGSLRKNWMFFEMEEGAEAQIIAPPHVLQHLKDVVTNVRRHVHSWTANLGSKELDHTIAILDAASKALRPILKRQKAIEADRNSKIKAIDIII